jgi:O-acetyl-ADP-ribose deacetylase (regulator of RNase III)
VQIQYIEGSLLDSEEFVIAHGCNAQGVMKSGVAKAIRERYPFVYNDYKNWEKRHALRLGDVITSGNFDRIILNIISQEYYGRDPSVVYVSYDAIAKAVGRINAMGLTRVAFPKIGAGLANGNWNIIASILESLSNFTPIVYYIDPNQAPGGTSVK